MKHMIVIIIAVFYILMNKQAISQNNELNAIETLTFD